MNSDEPQTPAQEPAIEDSDEQQPKQDLVVHMSDDSEELPAKEQAVAQPDEGWAVANSKPLQLQSNSAKKSVSDSQLDDTEKKSTIYQPKQSTDAPANIAELEKNVADLERQERELRGRINALQETHSQLLNEQLAQTQATMGRLVQEGLTELEQRKQALQISVEQLERRRERIRAEMRTTFAGVSQELAIRVQGFKDYLVGSLEDLVTTAEQLDLVASPEPSRQFEPSQQFIEESLSPKNRTTPQFAEQGFQEQARQISNILDQYRTLPDYYGPPWQLRRTFEPIHAERVSNWFFSQGGRGAIRTMGSRLQNILIASAAISVARTLYDERLRTLVLANTPERLGEWRRGLQDCLGISRSDFGPERGVVLFEEAPALVQKADRLIVQRQLPLIIIDETEDQVNLSVLQFPLWLAFAPDPQQMSPYQY
ncbi:DUF3086 domain-containing protein [Lyngbya aestuarii]|uniref:DUF3086 domain-containing protein n=1 Tax=Lyngbya aestuarii TaxID=118322 RepID=UPI00403DC97A